MQGQNKNNSVFYRNLIGFYYRSSFWVNLIKALFLGQWQGKAVLRAYTGKFSIIGRNFAVRILHGRQGRRFTCHKASFQAILLYR